MGGMSVFILLLRREARLLFRRPAELANPLVFFAIVVALFRWRLAPRANCCKPCRRAWCGWPRCWRCCCRWTACSAVISRTARWSSGCCHRTAGAAGAGQGAGALDLSGLALVLLAPLLALMLGLPGHCLPVLLASLLLGTPVLSLLGAVGAALTVGLKRGGLLLALLILPLYIPVLILGSGALQAALQNMPATGHLLWLASLTALAVTLAPFAIAAGLKISVGE